LKNHIYLHLLREFIILLIVGAIFILMVHPFKDFISAKYLLYFAVNIFLVVQFFRVVINERKVIWIRPFIVKAVLGLGCIALFILSIRFFMYFITQFEDYNYTGIGSVIKDITPGLNADDYRWLRTSTFLTGVSAMMFIILFELRMFYSIFKYRLVPGFRD